MIREKDGEKSTTLYHKIKANPAPKRGEEIAGIAGKPLIHHELLNF